MASFNKSRGRVAFAARLFIVPVVGFALSAIAPSEGRSMSWLKSDPAQTIAHQAPTSFCLPAETGLLADMMTGSKRPVLVLHAVNNVSAGRGKIEVRIEGTEIATVLGLFPGGGPQPGEESRFFLPRPENLGETPPCYIVTYLSNDGATAEISVELSDILKEGQE